MADTGLRPSIQGPPIRPTELPVIAQVGWLGHRDGSVYALADAPYDDREPGGFSPLYIRLGSWVIRDGKWVINE